jgi:hypothetical protein
VGRFPQWFLLLLAVLGIYCFAEGRRLLPSRSRPAIRSGTFAGWSIISSIALPPPAADCIPFVFAEQRGDALISGISSREQPGHQKCSDHTICRQRGTRKSFSANSLKVDHRFHLLLSVPEGESV